MSTEDLERYETEIELQLYREYRGWAVPEVLRSGDHARIARWRRAQALHRTRRRRPDLFAAVEHDPEIDALLDEFPPEA